jgi:hypothetical protein
MQHRAFLLVFLSLSLLITGCSQYVDDYEYVPRPAIAQVSSSNGQDPPVTVQISLVGIRRADSDLGIPNSVELRMQVQNTDAAPVTFDPATLVLINGDLLTFGQPIVSPPQVMSLAPGQQAIISANFPFPPGKWYDNMDMESLQLRWTVKVDGSPVGQFVYFRRVHYYYYDTYWNYPPPYWGWGNGGSVVIVHRH